VNFFILYRCSKLFILLFHENTSISDEVILAVLVRDVRHNAYDCDWTTVQLLQQWLEVWHIISLGGIRIQNNAIFVTRKIQVTERRTMNDFALFVKMLV
jgi:hypothetical protein